MEKKEKYHKKGKMYSPKVSEDLIPKLYQLARKRKKPMTHVVSDILRNYLNEVEIRE